MIEFRILKSGENWIAKRTDSSWTSGILRSEQDAIERATREARFMRDAQVVVVRATGEELLFSTRTPNPRRTLQMTLNLT